MVLPLLRAQESSSQPFLFGKLPSRPDFIRINATHPIAHEFDELLQNALGLFRGQEGWEERYDQASAMDVCYTSRDQKSVFLGVIRPSRDQSGRRYPLVAGLALPMPSVAFGRELIPIAYEVYFKGLREYLDKAVEGLDGALEVQASRQFLESQALEGIPDVEGFTLAEQIVKQFTESHHPLALEASLVSSESRASLLQALLNIAFYRDFLRRFYNPSLMQFIDLPLKGAPGEASLHACAWLSILTAIIGDIHPTTGGFLLTHGLECSRLYVAFGRLPERTILAALGGEVRKEDRLDLWEEQKTWQAHKLYAETAYAMEHLLHDPAMQITALCVFLKRASEKISAAGGEY